MFWSYAQLSFYSNSSYAYIHYKNFASKLKSVVLWTGGKCKNSPATPLIAIWLGSKWVMAKTQSFPPNCLPRLNVAIYSCTLDKYNALIIRFLIGGFTGAVIDPQIKLDIDTIYAMKILAQFRDAFISVKLMPINFNHCASIAKLM